MAGFCQNHRENKGVPAEPVTKGVPEHVKIRTQQGPDPVPNKTESNLAKAVNITSDGGTTGSIITGLVFDTFGGKNAFYLSLFPMALLAMTLFFFRNSTNKLFYTTTGNGN